MSKGECGNLRAWRCDKAFYRAFGNKFFRQPLNLGAALTWSFIATTNFVLAGPDEITQRFLDEKVSLLDWGVFRIQNLLNDADNIIGTNTVFFDWDENLFTVQGYFYGGLGSSLDKGVGHCRRWFNEIRGVAGVSVETGQAYGAHSKFADLFTHMGWENIIGEKSTSDLATKLDQKFQLEFTYYFNSADRPSALICTGKLIEISFSQKVESY